MPSRVKKAAKPRTKKENKEPKANDDDHEQLKNAVAQETTHPTHAINSKPKKTSRQIRSVKMLSSVLTRVFRIDLV